MPGNVACQVVVSLREHGRIVAGAGLWVLSWSCATRAPVEATPPPAPRPSAQAPATDATAPSVRTLALGWRHSCAVSAAGETRCWGLNHQGQLGDGSYVTRETAVAVTGLTGARALALGETHSCAVLKDGALSCWGDNGFGELGDGRRVGSTSPVRVVGVDDAAMAAAGEHHTCALERDGSVWCWGLGDLGQLGASVADSQRPLRVPLDEPAVEIAAGARFACARTKSGRVLCWGANLNGQLGDGTIRSRAAPAEVRGLAGAARILAAGQSACALDAEGALQCWGAPVEGGADRTHPTRVGATSFADVALGGAALCARARGSKEVLCAGQNVGTEIAFHTSLTAVPELEGATELAVGGGHACARRPDDTLVCFGWNEDGQVGDGSRARRAPVVVPGVRARLLASYADRTCAVTKEEAIVCWGGDDLAADGTTQRRTTPTVLGAWKSPVAFKIAKLALGEGTLCALAYGGAVQCLVQPGSRALGRNVSAPEMVALSGGGANIDLAVGVDHACVVTDKSPFCVGDGALGALGTSYPKIEPRLRSVLTTSRVNAIAATGSRTCAVSNGEDVVCWGGGLVAGARDAVAVARPNITVVAGVAADRTAIALGFDVGCVAGKGPTQCFGLAGELSGLLGVSPATTGNNRPGAATVPGADDARDVATSGLHGCVVLEAGSVRCWGQNDVGQLGRQSEGVDLVAREVPDVTSTKSVTVGARHSCALAFNGTVRCWGLAVHGQLGDGTTDTVVRPQPVVWR